MRVVNFILIALLLFLGACRHPKDLVYSNIQNFRINKAGLKQTALSLDIRMYNPNRYSMKLKNADIDVLLNGSDLGKVRIDGKCKIPASDTCMLPVTLDVDMNRALPNAIQLLLNDGVTIKLTGTIKAGRHGIYISIPISYEGKQDILGGIKW